jgi:hypothetical protein
VTGCPCGIAGHCRRDSDADETVPSDFSGGCELCHDNNKKHCRGEDVGDNIRAVCVTHDLRVAMPSEVKRSSLPSGLSFQPELRPIKPQPTSKRHAPMPRVPHGRSQALHAAGQGNTAHHGRSESTQAQLSADCIPRHRKSTLSTTFRPDRPPASGTSGCGLVHPRLPRLDGERSVES